VFKAESDQYIYVRAYCNLVISQLFSPLNAISDAHNPVLAWKQCDLITGRAGRYTIHWSTIQLVKLSLIRWDRLLSFDRELSRHLVDTARALIKERHLTEYWHVACWCLLCSQSKLRHR